MTPTQGSWTYNTLYVFAGLPDGVSPYSALTLDPSGDLFGTTFAGGLHNLGTVFEISPAGSGWNESISYSLSFDSGFTTFVGLARDAAGNLYGVTSGGGPQSGGTIFQLAPDGGGYAYSNIYSNFTPEDGGGAGSRLIMDRNGNLYGTAGTVGAHNLGMVYKLSRGQNGWTLTDMHDFGGVDGGDPGGDIVMDTNGNLYGVTWAGGSNGFGVVWEITP
jgi:uncharacterized repeat protein (TIGR03803 family)